MELKGLKVNIEKTKMMRSGKSGGEIVKTVKTGRWPCAVCGKGVGANSIQCSDCCGWVHKRCSGARCPLVTIQSFRCRICLTDEGVRSEGERMKNLNLENGEVLEGVSKFRYLGAFNLSSICVFTTPEPLIHMTLLGGWGLKYSLDANRLYNVDVFPHWEGSSANRIQ